MQDDELVKYRPLMGLGPAYRASASKAAFARVAERGYWVAWLMLAFGVSVWLAPYWGARILLIALGFYFPVAGALVEKMESDGGGTAKNFLWRFAAYGGLLFSLIAIGYNHWQTREEFLYWKYKWTDPAQLASVRFDFAIAPKVFNEPLVKQMYPGKPVRCMQFFPHEPQFHFGSNECYFWTDRFNELPAKMSEFVFEKDRLTAVRVEFPLWETGTHLRALTERYGPPRADSRAIFASLGGGPIAGLGLLALSHSDQLSVWTLPAGVLVTDAGVAWKEPYGLIFWMSRDWFCTHRKEDADLALKADDYCRH